MLSKKSSFLLMAITIITLNAVWSCGGNENSFHVAEVSAPTATITMNGNRDDWTSIQPLMTDKSDDDYSVYAACDARGLYVAMSPDNSMLYIMMDFYDGPPSPAFASDSTNNGYTTDGAFYALPDVKRGYTVIFDTDASGSSHFLQITARWDTVNEWHISEAIVTGATATGVTVRGNAVLEYSIPAILFGAQKALFVRGSVLSSAHPLVRDSVNDVGSDQGYRVLLP
jgi:hypothetical protein